jgi:hypothetical protein
MTDMALITKWCIFTTLLLNSFFAQAAKMPDSAFSLGVGANINNVNYNGQAVNEVGYSKVYGTTGNLISTGTAGGPSVNVDLSSILSVAPYGQGGYFAKFEGTEWLWGGKITYAYTNTSSDSSSFNVPQYGAYGSTPFVGNAVNQAYKVSLNNQFIFLPYLGRAFEEGYVYIGAGPTLNQVNSYINNVTGYATIGGVNTNISGAPQSVASNNRWIGGGAVSLGGTYFIAEDWFLDFSYTYTVTANYVQNYSSPFSNPASSAYNPSTAKTYTGTLTGISQGYISSNSFALTINKTF